MAKEKFERSLLYVGPVSSFSIVIYKKVNDVMTTTTNCRPLITGEVYDDLPKDHPVIKNLIAHELLVTPVDEVSDTSSPETVVSDSGTAKSGDTGRTTSDKSAK